jgi:hypothetical protein
MENADADRFKANRGLGLEFARQYLVDGWQVYALVVIQILLPSCSNWLTRVVTSFGS